MTVDNFSQVQSRIHRFNLSQAHSALEWQSFFDDGIELLDHPDNRAKDYAVERIQKGIWAEAMQGQREPGFVPAAAEQRILPILRAIARQEKRREHCLLRFAMWSALPDEAKKVFSQWLTTQAESGTFPADAISTARIQAELYPYDWTGAKDFLEPFFCHQNDLLRAAAANGFGKLFSNGAKGLPRLDEVMQQVKQWEIERPGFAGPFITELLMNPHANGEIEGSGVTLTDWILEIIAKRKSDEPSVSFYNGIDFHAHEILSNNPDAVRKLMNFGAESLAAMTATEENFVVAGMQELLEELANSSDDSVSRICSWHLAYHYRFLHKEGERRGYVQLFERDTAIIFLVFAPEHSSTPYAATVYPRKAYLSNDLAWTWIDALIPPESRPNMEDNEWPYKTPQIRSDSATYAYGAYVAKLYGDHENGQWDRIWIKWPRGEF